MMNQHLAQAVKYWDYISPAIKHPDNQTEFEELVSELYSKQFILRPGGNKRVEGVYK